MNKIIQNLFLMILVGLTLNGCGSNADKKFEGFMMPESVAEGPDGSVYVSEIGERDVDKDGKISKINRDGTIETVASGLFDPKGIVFYKDKLYVTDRDVVIEVDLDGTWQVYAGTMLFPKVPVFFNDIDVSNNGTLYVSDSGDFKKSGFIFAVKPSGEIGLLFEGNDFIKAPNGVLVLDDSKLLIVDWAGDLLEGNLKSQDVIKLGEGFEGGDGLAIKKDTIYISSWTKGTIYSFKNGKTTLIAEGFEAAADIALVHDKKVLVVPDMKAGTVTFIDI
jgi:hypothetical protein